MESSEIDAIMIENVGEDEIEDILILFENERKTGGGRIAKHEYFDTKDTIVVFYQDPKKAYDVLKIDTVCHRNKTYAPKRISIEKLDSLRQKVDSKSSKIFIDGVLEDEVESVMMLFENERKSGGGPIKNHLYNKDEKKLTIEFEDSTCVERTVNKGAIIFKNKEYKAKKYSIIQENMRLLTSSKIVHSDELNLRNKIDDFANAIMIENVGEDEIEDVLMLFENERKTGGGRIAKHEYFDTKDTIVVFYQDPKKAYDVLKTDTVCHRNKTYAPKRISIEKFELLQQKACAIMIENISKDEIEDILLLFENERKTGGSKIAEHEYFDQKETILIFYENPKTAFDVLKKGSAVFNEKIYLPKKVSKMKLESLKQKANSKSSKIYIDEVSEDEVESVVMLFENERKSGGGPIKEHSYNKDEKILIIEFEDSCVERTINKGAINYKGKQYKAQKYSNMKGSSSQFSKPFTADNVSKSTNEIHDQYDNLKFKMIVNETDNNNNEVISNETIQLYLNFLLQDTEHDFYKIDYGIKGLVENRMEFLINCKKPIDFEKINGQNKKKPKLMEKSVGIERVKVARSVIVQTKEHKDVVELYFQNANLSGGGDIKIFKKIEGLGDDFGIFLIEFEDKICANRVFGKTHRPGMKVQLFYDNIQMFASQMALELKEANMRINKTEELLTLSLLSTKFPYSFVTKQTEFSKQFKEILTKDKAELTILEDRLEIKYPKSNERVVQEIKKFEEKFDFYEWTVETDLLIKLKQKLVEFYSNTPSISLLFIDENEKQVKIRIEGDAEVVKGEMNKISQIINDDNNKKIEDKVTNLREYQCVLLLKSNFIKSTRQVKQDIAIKIAPPSGTITFNGYFDSVLWAKQSMWDIIHTLRHKEDSILLVIAKFLIEKREYVVQEFESNKIICEFEIILKNDQLTSESELSSNGTCKIDFYAIDDSESLRANQFINENFIQFKYDIREESLELLDNLYPQFLQQTVDKMKLSQENDHVTFISSKENRKVWCVGQRLLVNDLSKKIIDFFETNTELSTFCELPVEDLRYLNIVKNREIMNLCMNIQKQTKVSAFATFETTHNDPSQIRLKLTGTQQTISRLKREFQNLTSKKVHSYFEIKDSSVFDLFTSERGIRNLFAIETQSQCLIMNTKDIDELQVQNASPVKNILARSTSRVENCIHQVKVFGVTINVINSSLHKFENADVITISAQSDLSPFDDVSRMVVEKTNGILLPEIRRLLHENDVFEGDAYPIRLGALGFCKCIVHAIVPKKIEDSEEKEFFKACIKDSLTKTNEFRSIAFPLLYGQKLARQDVRRNVIDSLIKSIFKYFPVFPKSNLKEIYIVDDKYSDFVVDNLKRFAEQYQLDALSERRNSDEDLSETETETPKSRIRIEVGTILDNKFQIDAIVNTTSSDLNLNNGTVSKLILKQAGEGIQTELKQKYTEGLSDKCLVGVSTAGNISKVNFIFHVSLDKYDKNKDDEVKHNFKKIITQLMITANENNCKSIAMPAIGTGILNYPRDKVAKWMFAAINNYFAQTKKTTVEFVVIVLYDKDVETIKEFKIIEAQEKNGGTTVEQAVSKKHSTLNNNNMNADSNFYTNLTTDEKNIKMRFRNVNIEVFIGDICASKEQVIINPTNYDFNLSGNVSKALLRSAGNSLKDELGSSPKLNKNGVFWTNAGNLDAKKILHIDVQSAEIKECIVNSLAFVDDDEYHSVVYPVIGTGALNKDPRNAVKEILEGFAIYIHKKPENRSLNIKGIKVCIYEAQANILQLFNEEMKELMKQRTFKASPWYAKAYDKAKNLFGYFIKTDNKNEAEIVSSTEVLKFKLVSDDEENIENAKGQLLDIMHQDKMTEILTHKHLKTLTTQQDDKLMKICKVNHVKGIIDKDLGKMKLAGRTQNVTKCMSELNKELNDYMKGTFEEAHEMARNIQWEFCVNKNKWRAYNIYLNAKIEEAYKNKEKEFMFDDENDEKCLVDFGIMSQHRKVNRQKMYDIRRVDLKNRVELKIPIEWDSTKTCDLVKLDSNSEEYQGVLRQLKSNKFGNHTIVSIERIQNQRLYVQYQAHRKHFEERDKDNVNEKVVFHGTTSDTYTKIWKFGFNRSFAGKNATVYGKGVYFAREANYSHQYTDLGNVGRRNVQNKAEAHLFVCKVLIGYSAVGGSDVETKNLPMAPDGTTPVDSTVDQAQNPSIFVIYHDAQAYPEYLVTYK